MESVRKIDRKLNYALCVFLMAFVFFGCEQLEHSKQKDPKKNVKLEVMNDSDFEILVIDSCEYVVFARKNGYAGFGGICHKQNCVFCEERGENIK